MFSNFLFLPLPQIKTISRQQAVFACLLVLAWGRQGPYSRNVPPQTPVISRTSPFKSWFFPEPRHHPEAEGRRLEDPQGEFFYLVITGQQVEQDTL